MIGTRQIVLVEKPGFGRTPCFAPVAFDGGPRPGRLRAALRITGAAAAIT